MKKWLFHRRQRNTKEHRLLNFEAPADGAEQNPQEGVDSEKPVPRKPKKAAPPTEGVGDLGTIEFDTNPYDTDNLPTGTLGKDGETMSDRVKKKHGGPPEEMTATSFREMLASGTRRVYNGIIQKEHHGIELRKRRAAEARAQGKYRYMPEDYGEYSFDLAEQLGLENFNRLMDDATRHIWRMPDMQKGVVKITAALERAWNYVWDAIQVNKLIPSNHPLIRSGRWKDGMRVPGSYYDGHLGRIGSNMLGNYSQRRLSGELDRFRRLPASQKRFTRTVPALYRGRVQSTANASLGLNKLQFDRLQWTSIQEGNDTEGLPHVFVVHKEGGKKDDAGHYLPGEEPFDGMVHVFGDYDNPETAEVIYMDFDKVNRMLNAMKNSPFYETLVTRKGYFSEGQARMFDDLLKDFPDNPTTLDEVGVDFYKDHPQAGRLLKEMGEMQYIVETLQASGIQVEDLGWLRSLDIVGDRDRGTKVFNLRQRIKADGGVGSRFWRRAMSVYLDEFKDNPARGADWFDEFLNP